MAFYSYADLIQQTIVRLRQVPGAGTQLYSEDVIGKLIVETYEYVRSLRYWDHLTKWLTRDLTGTDGLPTIPFAGARDGWNDIDRIVVGSSNTPLPLLSNNINPYRLTGTYPRYVEPLHQDDDISQFVAELQNIFRIWPLTAIATGTTALRVHIRVDPANLFTDPNVVVPFDHSILINGAAAKYSADDGTNPASVAMLNNAYQTRLEQRTRQFDNQILIKDDRMLSPYTNTQWQEDY